MKKFLRTTALSLATAMMMGVTAFAAELPKVKPVNNQKVSAVVTSEKKLDSVTYENTVVSKDGQYMIFVVDGTLPTADSILYINQEQADENGKVEFNNVYPKEMKNSNIMISGTGLSSAVTVAELSVGGTDDEDALIGDVNGDNAVDVGDATQLLRYLAGLIKENDLNLNVADVNGDGSVDVGDATRILRDLAGLKD